jgi:hypothetical protein
MIIYFTVRAVLILLAVKGQSMRFVSDKLGINARSVNGLCQFI